MINPLYLEKSLSYEDYKKMVADLLSEGRSTGPPQSESYLHYTRLSVQRMHRVEKTLQLLPEVKASMEKVRRAQTWLVLTEGWCGDAAQSMPVMQALAQLNPLITLRCLLRDENLELMDQYLTNGVSRSIPKLISLDTATLEELFNWGPRPTPLQEIFYRMRAEGIHHGLMVEEFQRWYNADKTITAQKELAGLASGQITASGQPLP